MVSVQKRRLDDGSIHVTVAGKIDEKFDPAQVTGERAPRVVLDLAGVYAISSLGVREFETLVSSFPGCEVVLERVSPAIANQLVMIPNLIGPGTKVESATLPFVCPACGAEKAHAVPFARGASATHAPRCGCGASMELDGIPEQYLPA
jgi:hypothetical protein